MSELGITIQGQSFPHLIYHLVLTYSNWESATVCFSNYWILVILSTKWGGGSAAMQAL